MPGDRPLSGRVVRIAAKKISGLGEVRVLSTAPAALEPQRVQQVTGTTERLTGPKYKRAVQMLFRMISPRVTKSRSIVVRKGIPKDVRDDYERLYGQRWEAKLTLPAGVRPQDYSIGRRMVVARSQQRALLKLARRLPSSTPSSVGRARRWLRSTPKPPIANVWRLGRWRRCKAKRTKLQHLFPHLVVR